MTEETMIALNGTHGLHYQTGFTINTLINTRGCVRAILQ